MLRRSFLLLAAAPALPTVGAAQPRRGRRSPGPAAISPSGQQVALVSGPSSPPAVLIRDFVTGRPELRAELPPGSVGHLHWAGERRLLVLNGLGDRATAAFVLDVPGRRLTRVLRESPRAPRTILGAPMVRELQGRAVVFLQVAAAFGRGGVSLVRADLGDPEVSLAAPLEPGARSWVVDARGEPVAVELSEPAARRWTLRLRAGGAWREVAERPGGAEAARLLGLARDARAVLYAVRERGGDWSWREARLDGAPPGSPLVVGPAAEPVHDPQDGRVIGYSEPHGYTFFAPEDASAWRAVAGAFPNDQVRLVSWSADRRRILALVDSAAEGSAYAQVDLATRVATWLGPDPRSRETRDAVSSAQ